MTQIHFTLNPDEIQKLINRSVYDDLAKNLLTTVFNQLMETNAINTLVLVSLNAVKSV